MKNNLRNHLLSGVAVLLAICMLFTSVSLQAFAAEGGDSAGNADGNILTEENVDLKNWMSGLPGEWKISEINMPGTHDTGTAHVSAPVVNWFTSSYGSCQKWEMDEQLEHGLRVFDIRLAGEKKAEPAEWKKLLVIHEKLDCYTGWTHFIRLKLKHILSDCEEFLEDHPRETIILTYATHREGYENATKMIRQGIEQEQIKDLHCPYVIYYQDDPIPTLDDVRGKIVFMDNESVDGVGNGTMTNYENHWHCYETAEKVSYVKKALDDAQRQNFAMNRGNFSNQEGQINNSSGKEGEPAVKCVYSSANGMSGPKDVLKMPPTPADHANQMKSKLFKNYKWKKGYRYGWIMMDFPVDRDITSIINTNYDYIIQHVKIEVDDQVQDPRAFSYYESETTKGKVKDASLQWIKDDELEITNLPRKTGGRPNHYVLEPELPVGWTCERSNNELVNGIETYTLKLHPPKAVELKIHWDCYPEHAGIPEALNLKAHYLRSSNPDVQEKVETLSQKVIRDGELESVVELVLASDAPNDAQAYGGMFLELKTSAVSSGYHYDPDQDFRKVDDHHYEITLHTPGEKQIITGAITFVDDENRHGTRPRAGSAFWNGLALTGHTQDRKYTADMPLEIPEADRGKNTINWKREVPVTSPDGDDLIWEITKAASADGYDHRIEGLDLTYELQPYRNAVIRWKNDTEEQRPEELGIMLYYKDEHDQKVGVGYDLTNESKDWSASFGTREGDREYSVELPYGAPTGYEVTKSGPENGIWVIELSYVIHTITVTNGTANMDEAKAGERISIEAAQAPEGQEFDSWETVCGNVEYVDPESEKTSFLLPDEDVWIQAVYRDLPPARHTVKIDFGTGTSQSFPAIVGDDVGLHVDQIPIGKAFDQWEVVSGTVNILDEMNPDTMFTMPDEDVVIQATYKDEEVTYTVDVINGTVDGTGTSKNAKEGDTITLMADLTPEGKTFTGWTVICGNVSLADDSAATTTFTMPAEDVTVKALFRDTIHAVHVTSGKASVDSAAEGASVTITADAAPQGQEFDRWEDVFGNVTYVDQEAVNTSFTMPATDVWIQALYKESDPPAQQYCVTTVGGTATPENAAAGTEISLNTLEVAEGMLFDHWEVLEGNVTLTDNTKETTTFYMPAENVRVKAIYKETHRVDVINGTADPFLAAPTKTITVTARAAQEGMRFDKWEIVSGEIELADEEAASTTFTMPDTDVVLRATYRDANFMIRVTDGIADKNAAAEGETVTITANAAPEGKEFAGWYDTYGNVEYVDQESDTTSFSMPATDVWLQAVYQDKEIPAVTHKVTVIGGSANPGQASAGTEISLTAAKAPTGFAFDRWKVSIGNVTFVDASSENTAFLMPDTDVTVMACFKNSRAKKYSIVVTDGKTSKYTAHKGDLITVTANAAPEGKMFDRWEDTLGMIAFADQTNRQTTFIMPATDVWIQAVYQDKQYDVTVHNGTATPVKAAPGTQISIKADQDIGFDHWEAVQGTVNFTDQKAENTTFIMPASDVEIRAYSQPEGLSIPVEKIIVTGISHKIAAGKKIRLKAKVLPENATNKAVSWKTSGSKVASVTQKGIVKVRKKTGKKRVDIIVTATDGSKVKAVYQIRSMKGVVKKITLSGKKTVKAGSKIKLKATITASKGANRRLKWTSSNKDYATVSSQGVVKGLKAGKGKSVTITAKATDGSGKKATKKIRIVK